jgi:cell division transport system ATP-binding protein
MIDLKNVSKTYSSGVDALNDVTIHIDKGEFVFIVGTSGSGKSTLIKLLLKELEPTSGKIVINGKDVSKVKRRKLPLLRRDIGVVFQDFRLLEDRNVFENVAFAQKAIEAPNRRIRSKVLQKLAVVGLVDKIRVNPKELSGGEQQRVAIARALVNEPAILLADEPTGNLDENNSWDIMKLLEEANEAGTTVIVVTHNMDIVRNMKRRTIRINDGVVTHDVKEGGMIYEV